MILLLRTLSCSFSAATASAVPPISYVLLHIHYAHTTGPRLDPAPSPASSLLVAPAPAPVVAPAPAPVVAPAPVPSSIMAPCSCPCS